jgi:HAD superfamily hydrolase (TIGR01509 family)
LPLACLLLDLDGTLVDTKKLMLESYCQTLCQVGVRDYSREDLKSILSDSPPSVLKRFGVSSTDVYWNNYAANLSKHVRVFDPNLSSHLRTVHATRKQIGVVTSLRKPLAQALLSAIGIADLVDTLVAYGDTRVHKPAPNPILKALTNLSIAADQSIYIGDQASDVQAGKRAGVLTGVALWGTDRTAFSDIVPDFFFHHFSEVVALVRSH